MQHAHGKLSGSFDDNKLIVNMMIAAAQRTGLTIVKTETHEFYPQGLTCFLLLSESHFAIHTYPEKNTAWCDCFSCGDHDPRDTINMFSDLAKLKVEGINLVSRENF